MKKFIMGLIIGSGLMIAVSAHAEVTSLVGSVIQGEYLVKVNGEQIDKPAIVINGTSYLPARTIAELSGYKVSFNSDQGIELTSPVADANPIQTVEEVIVPIEKRLEIVNSKITRVQAGILTNQGALELGGDTSEIEEAIRLYEEELAALKAEKAMLEAQLESGENS